MYTAILTDFGISILFVNSSTLRSEFIKKSFKSVSLDISKFFLVFKLQNSKPSSCATNRVCIHGVAAVPFSISAIFSLQMGQ